MWPMFGGQHRKCQCIMGKLKLIHKKISKTVRKQTTQLFQYAIVLVRYRLLAYANSLWTCESIWCATYRMISWPVFRILPSSTHASVWVDRLRRITQLFFKNKIHRIKRFTKRITNVKIKYNWVILFIYRKYVSFICSWTTLPVKKGKYLMFAT